MTPRPLYRWKSLWLGILVASSIAWAWRDSMRYTSSVTWRQAHAANHGGGVALGHRNPRIARLGKPVMSTPRWDRYVPDFEVTSSVFAALLFLRGGDATTRYFDDVKAIYFARSYRESLAAFMNYQPGRDWLLFIPHWLVMLAFVLPWSAFVIWRARRMKRITTNMT